MHPLAAFLVCGVLAVYAAPAIADQDQIRNYRTARDRFVYDEVYPSGGRTIYCDSFFVDRSGLQVEHVLPASWMKEAADCEGQTRRECRRNSERFNFMEADLHNLWPALADANQDRSNFEFGIIGQDTVDNWEGFCDFEVDRDARRVEPRPAIRGDIARMVLYMVAEYGIELPGDQHELLVAWHCGDNTPSAEEVRRNTVIATLQGTRNPFIDNPRLLCEEGEQPGPGDAVNDVWEECDIKGNIGGNGVRIYHTPDSPHYAATKINTLKGERWFCSVAEAEAAGWRAPR